MNKAMALVPAFLSNGGEMGALMRAHDWSATPLGPPQHWPQSLKSMVGAVLNSPQLGTVLWGPELRMLYNDVYIPSMADRHPRALGRPVAQVWGDVWDLVSPLFHRALETGEGFSQNAVELPMVRLGKQEITYWNITASPIWGEDGTIVGLLNLGVEITSQVYAERERHRAQIALRDLNISLERQVAERTSERNQVWQVSRDMLLISDERGRVLSVNPAWTRVLGWTDQELLGRTSEWLEHPDDWAKTRAEIGRLAEGRSTLSFENRFRNKDGDYRTLSWTAVPVDGLFYCTARDVTEEREQARALHLSEHIIQSDPSPIIAFDRDYRLIGFNRAHRAAFLRVMGHDQKIGEVLPDLFPPEQAAVLKALMDRALAGETFAVVEEFGGADRVKPTWEIAYSPLRNVAGQVIGAFQHSRDISARLSAERERDAVSVQLAEQNAARERTWQFTPDLFSVIHLESAVFERINPAWTTILGWSRDEIEGKTYTSFVHPDDGTASNQAFAQVRAGNPVLRFENRYRTKDGGWRTLSWVAFPEGDKLYSSARDVTEEREQAKALHLFENIAQSNDAPICVFDHEFRLTAFNRAHSDEFFRIFAHRVQVGDVFPDLFSPDQAPIIRGFMARALAGETYTVTEKFGDPELANPYWEVSYSPLRDQAGRIIGAFHIALDITARLRAEVELANTQEALRQSQKMEAVGQLTGGLAHDFNNLLAGISGSLELMQTRMQQGRLNDVGRYMGAAQGAAKRAAALTHRLLAFSRRQTLDPKPTDVTRLAMGMQEMIQRTVGPAIPVEVVGATGVWPALVDPSQLENALLNLCINARDAMPDGGRITIETANKWMDERAASQHDMPEGQYLSLAVTDTGTGMPPEVVTRVFEPFFTTKPIGMGTGLGLSMIYGFAQQSGGQVRIYSEVGQGTTVAIYLPRHYGAAEEEKAIGKSAHLPRSKDGETVLIVDDEPTVRMLVTDILDDLGYAAIEAGDSATGLKVLQSDVRIDLLVTDVGLPGGMNGRQMADAARQVRPDLKVLFITGYAENAILNSGQLGPGMAILTKPFPMETMAARIRSMIEGRKAQARPL